MSGHSDSAICPVCGESMNTYSDYKPHDYVSGDCLTCGFQYWTTTGQLDLKSLNEMRVDIDLEPLEQKDLYKWKKDIENLG